MNENHEEKLEYDVQKRARAGTAATFRGIVAAYLAYLGVKLIRGASDSASDMPAWAGWAAGLFFIAAALGFGYYIWKRWRQDVEAARLPEENTEEDAPET